jgi:hypothetical protein
MGRICGTYGGEERCIQGFSREGDHLEDPGIDRWIILKWRFERGVGGGGCMHWINLAQDRDKWQALVNVVMNLWVP